MNKTMSEASEDRAREKADFRARLEDKYDTSTYQKRDLLWQRAWDYGRIHGLADVEYWYSQLVELLP